ncbi:thioesterase family protein [Allosalinactinospora lopnorensis]|uniref:thioesterase family protein n=1 Tax=Allosalinactinospora lopnorensis TaxID=1352348 RepID=UPI000623D609|nr:thioesterase family protein [Allosalinactinospora lopnorensis]
MTRFDSATTVTAAADGRYTAELDPGFLIGSAMNGGYLMAVMQRAVLAESAHPHPVSSAYHFLRPAAAGPADFAVTALKSGRTVTTFQVTASQNGTPVVIGILAAATLDPAAAPEYEAPQPEFPPIEHCRRFDPREGAAITSGFPERVDQFFTPESLRRLDRLAPDPVPELCGHIRLSEHDGGPAAEPSRFLPLAVDALPPVVSVLDSWRWAPTVELTWHMRAVPEAGPLAFRSCAGSVNDGWFDETVDLWDVKGRLVAQSRQLARIGRRAPD